MSPPRLASSSVRRNIIRIKIKKPEKKTELIEAGAVLTSTKEELHPNSSPDMKLHQSTCCSSQVARVAPAESPTQNLESQAGSRPMHYPHKRRISDLASDQYQKRRKLIDDSLREKGTDSDGNKTIKEETRSSMSVTHQIPTSTGSSCVLERQEKGKIGDSTEVPKANESEESFLLLNEARDFKHRADRLKRKGEKPLSTLLYLEAVLKFLQVASLWENEQGENNKAAVRLYSDTAMLCKYCASQCEQEKNMPAAAIAYKALELIHMRHAFLISPALATNEAGIFYFKPISLFSKSKQSSGTLQHDLLNKMVML
ncbi:uncharacterized protein LOC144554781 isoform X2 [Carex rostrata]